MFSSQPQYKVTFCQKATTTEIALFVLRGAVGESLGQLHITRIVLYEQYLYRVGA